MDKELHTVKRAVIVAAGEGIRMRPLSLTMPKPLIPVNGIRMIDTVIDGLYSQGIKEIYIVVGYRKEQFAAVMEKYPGVVLIDNPWYSTCNNISSLYCARDYLEDCMILDGDQIIYNPVILRPGFKRSGYNAVYTESATSEWLMQVRGGIVVSCSRTGGTEGWQLYSISRWTKEDGRKLRRHLEIEFEEKLNRGIYWDDVAMFVYPDQYRLGIMPMDREDLVELDSVEELVRIDPSYQYLLGTQKEETR